MTMTQRWMVAVAAAATLAVGCGASDTTGSDVTQPSVTASSAPSQDGCSPPAGEGLESILALVPDDADNREYTVVADLRAFLDDQGKELPGDFDEIEWVDAVARFTPTELVQNAVSQADDGEDPLADEYGIGLGEIDQSVVAGMPPVATELLIGTFDPAKVDEAVGADEFWSAQQEEVESNGETYYAWGEDGEVQIEGRSPIRELGIGGRLWVDERVAAFTRATAPMEAFLAGCAGAEPTLADDDTFAGIAQHLDAYDGAFNITFTDQVRTPDEIAPDGGLPGGGGATNAADATVLEGVVAYGFASGPSDDPDEARIRLVLASGSDAQAAANEQRFVERVEIVDSVTGDQAWADVLRIESTEVDGPFLIVELRAESSAVLDNELMRRDSLIVSEG
jgi:hypothetical protein